MTTKQYFIDHIKEMEGAVLERWFPRMIATGCDTCDVQRIQKRLTGWDSWPGLWEETGDIHHKLAEGHLAEGFKLSAGNAFRRASINYHFGSFMLFDKPEIKLKMREKLRAEYLKALPMLKYPGKKVSIPYQDKSLPAYYRQGATANGRLVIVWPGADAIKEEMSYYDEVFLERGLSTLTVDGPGQGEASDYGNVFTISKFDAAVHAVVKYIKETLGYNKIGVFGISMGGFLAMRSAAVAPNDFKAAAGSGGGYEIFRKGSVKDAAPMFPADFSHVTGIETMEELAETDLGINLDGVAKNIICPILVAHGDLDTIAPASVAEKIIKEAVNSRDARLIMVKNGNHVVNSHTYLYRPQTGDFMLKYLV